MSKCIAIFGCNGYLGSELTAFFSKSGYTCDGFDLADRMKEVLLPYLRNYHTLNVVYESSWEVFEPSAYDVILFFAGMTGTENGFQKPLEYLMANEAGLLNLLTYLSPLGEKSPKVIFPSSRLVYKGSDHPLAIDAPKDTKTVYAVNKLACEGYLAAYHNRFGIPYAVVRICVPYGSILSGDYSYGTIGFFVKQAKAGGPILIYGDGTQRRTFSHIVDIAVQVERLAEEKDNSGLYNIGGCMYSLKEAAEIVAVKYGVEVTKVPWPEIAFRLESGSTVFDTGDFCASLSKNAWRRLEDCEF